ncbi:MAG: hypothetical protein JWM89_2216, partial [Acidimicrobiales bacterium]|nr:hypothetical protein [Acidimicrobiales bacterium]
LAYVCTERERREAPASFDLESISTADPVPVVESF